jgi:hypothetical protein
MSGAHIAFHAARRRREQQETEEIDMTPYTRDELQAGWEFKVMRSATGAFKDPDALEEMLAQESLAGWDLLEKFDDQRVRLKRPSSARRKDALLAAGYDPYRTQHGYSAEGLALRIVAALTLLGVLAGLAIELLAA